LSFSAASQTVPLLSRQIIGFFQAGPADFPLLSAFFQGESFIDLILQGTCIMSICVLIAHGLLFPLRSSLKTHLF
jgi:hypothetical protein